MFSRNDRRDHPDDSAAAPEVRIRGLDFAYANRPLFRDFGFTVAAGRWTCLLGPSGCGKSTLLRIISGSLEPAAPGAVLFDGRPRRRGQAAWMAQRDLLLPWLTVHENILLGPRLRGRLTAAHHRRARRLLRSVGLEEQGGAYPDTLSGGMRQRVALLRTLVERRPVILMDEPFSALDALTRRKLQNLAAERVGGATVLLVTHDPWEALRLGHRIFVMKGRPVRLGRVFEPAGRPPREADRPSIAAMHGDLLAALEEEGCPCSSAASPP